MTQVLRIHERDPNFPHNIILRIDEFLRKSSMTSKAYAGPPPNTESRERRCLPEPGEAR